MHALFALMIAATAEDADARLAEAQSELDKMQSEDAEKKLEALVADPAVSEAVRAKAWLTLGLARASLLDNDGARVAFAAALAIDGSLAPPAETSPKVKAMFEAIKSKLPAGGTPMAPVEPAPPPPVTPTPAATVPPKPPVTTAPPDTGGYVGATIAGAACLAVAAGAIGGALAADDALATPVKGRTHDQYETIRGLGIAGVVGAAVLGVAGAAAVAIGVGGMS